MEEFINVGVYIIRRGRNRSDKNMEAETDAGFT